MTFSALRRSILLILCVALAPSALGVSRATGDVAQTPNTNAPERPVASAEEARARCGTTCHRFPPPSILPRAAWREELVRMMLIQEGVPEPVGASSFVPLPPDWMALLRYYEAEAPERLPDPAGWPGVGTSPVRFTRRPLAPDRADQFTAISNLRALDIDGDGRLDVVASEMHGGSVFAGLASDSLTLVPVAQLRHPAHIDMADLDRDGLPDLIVAELGSFQPADHDLGAVYWLQRQRDRPYRAVALATGLPRVADARAADLDADGDLDIVVAAFGWRRTGSIFVLENRTVDWSSPVFVQHVVDRRAGAIHVPVADLNRDGRPDFVALLAQEHESVIAFVNTGRGLTFEPHVIYEAPHPNWGSSGIELVDLDGDGDSDVLMTHGDTFDDFIVKPYHGIQWLENRGAYPYVSHELAIMPGAHRAQAADLDGDGDLDVVASAMIIGAEGAANLASLVWLEQERSGEFERHTLETGALVHATLDVGDYDGDGRPDLAVGAFSSGADAPAAVELWLTGRR